jgi:hypothetical protein
MPYMIAVAPNPTASRGHRGPATWKYISVRAILCIVVTAMLAWALMRDSFWNSDEELIDLSCDTGAIRSRRQPCVSVRAATKMPSRTGGQ